MVHPTNPTTNQTWRIVVIGAEDVAQHFRKAGHRVLSLEQLPEVGWRGADAAVMEIDGNLDARSANKFRANLVEPILIHRRPSDRSSAFLSLRRKTSGEIALWLLEDALRHAVERTVLMRRLDEEDCDADAPTRRVTLEFPAPGASGQKTTVAPRRRRAGGAS